MVWVFSGLIASPILAERPDIASVLKTAVSGSGEKRYTAIDDLGERHEAADLVVPALAKLLRDSDRQVRWRSARALGDYGEGAQSAVADLRELLRDPDPVIQYHAAATLGKAGDRSDETVDALVAAATRNDARVARAAIAALRNLKPDPQRVLTALETVLQSNDRAVVVYALEALVERGDDAVPMLNEALKRPGTAYLACAAIEQIGPPAAPTVPALIELLGSTKHSQLQIQVLLALARIGPAAKPAAPQILPLLETTTDSTVPVAAAYALGSIGATDADAALRAAQNKPNEFLNMVATWSLAKIHPEDARLKQQAIDRLKAGLQSKDAAIQAAAEKGLKLLQLPPQKPAAN
jgi:HEAT repeat protein